MVSSSMFIPVGDRIVLRQYDEGDMTTGGVIIPDTTQEGSLQGEVVAVGPGRILDNGERGPMQCNVGDIVVYPKFGTTNLDVEGDEYFILRENDVLTIIEKGEDNG
tara:strand:- start:305 stop:622 length:318 start_codon:yes stop_codon:yes gene_type:complete